MSPSATIPSARALRSVRGFAVPLVLVVLVALGLVGAAAAFLTAGDANVATLYSTANRAADASGAGLEHGLAQYRGRIVAWNPSQGDQGQFVLAGTWPVTGSIDGYGYTVTIKRDSFDFNGDGVPEAVSCEGNGGGNGGSNGNGGSGGGTDTSGGGPGSNGGGSNSSGGGSNSTPADTNKYWEDGSTTDKNGDGQLGFAEGHFDVDVFHASSGSVSTGRDFHQHQFDDKYDTISVDLYRDPHLLWDQLVGKNDNAYPNDLRMQFINQDSARGTLSITLKGTTTVLDLTTAQPMTFTPKDLKGLRVQFESLGSMRKTSPGNVKSDAVNRDHSWTVRFFDTKTGRLVYENSEYWHYKNNKNATTGAATGGSTTTTGGGKNCKNAADHEKKALDHEEKAKKKEAEAQELYAKGKTKDGDKKMQEAASEWAKANEEWAKAEADCTKAKNAGENCVCGGYQTGSEPDETATPPDTTYTPPDTVSTTGSTGSNGSGGGTGGQWCEVNGNGGGNPVFILTSTATRGSWRATQRMRVSALSGNRVLRLSWLAN